MALSVGKGSTLRFDFNTVYSASATAIEIDCDTSKGACDSTSLVDYRNNIFIGFPNSTSSGYPSSFPITNHYSNPIYTTTGIDLFGNPGSVFSNNVTFQPKSYWTCPAAHEINAMCGVDRI